MLKMELFDCAINEKCCSVDGGQGTAHRANGLKDGRKIKRRLPSVVTTTFFEFPLWSPVLNISNDHLKLTRS